MPKSGLPPRFSCTTFLDSEKIPCTPEDRPLPTPEMVPLAPRQAARPFQPNKRLRPPGSSSASMPVSKNSSAVLTMPNSCKCFCVLPAVTAPIRKLSIRPLSRCAGTCSRLTIHARTRHPASFASCAARKKASSDEMHTPSLHRASAPWYSVSDGNCGHAPITSNSAKGLSSRLVGICIRRSAASMPSPTTSPSRGRKRS